eukprot:TRINITY_DN3068_c11_g1_i1.p1 TRINITY_DN3068_c11_g1~~TRINITY_DN3068_c11_g1_i1.p1  ORF type:complete len:663 (+),score=147.74 TRINITY_DN3068_c11_g1_i1:32-2020(+)
MDSKKIKLSKLNDIKEIIPLEELLKARSNELENLSDSEQSVHTLSEYSEFDILEGGALTEASFSAYSGDTVSVSERSILDDHTDLEDSRYHDDDDVPIPVVEIETVVKEIKDEDLDNIVTITLTETDTCILFNMPSIAYSVQNEELSREVIAANDRYTSQRSKYAETGGDLVTEMAIQTFKPPNKTKSTLTHRTAFKSANIQVSPADLYEFENKDISNFLESDTLPSNEKDENPMQGKTLLFFEKVISTNLHANLLRNMFIFETHYLNSSGEVVSTLKAQHILSISSKRVPGVSSDLSVVGIKCHPVNPLIFAVAYGHLEYDGIYHPGFITLWHFTNLMVPAGVIEVPATPTAIVWSRLSMNTLAVGLRNGDTYFLDCSASPISIISSTNFDSGRHLAAIWAMDFVDAYGPSGQIDEGLVTAGVDGQVRLHMPQHSRVSSLMKLKNVRNTVRAEPVTEPFITRHAMALSLDFNPDDTLNYIVGTAGGPIIRCSRTYSEQYLQLYQGHSEAVYQTRYSPHASNVFLSCSEDWTIRVWSEESAEPLMTLFVPTRKEAIYDVAWCPFKSTALIGAGGVNNDISVELWDLAKSTASPMDTLSLEGGNVTRLEFSKKYPFFIAGTQDGSIHFVKVRGIEEYTPTEENKNEQAKLLTNTLHSVTQSFD